MRAGALGTSAGIQVVLSATPPDPSRIYASVQDLVTNQALINGDANTALAVIDAALQEVARSRGAVGTLQANTVERVMDSLRVSSVNLREFESTLRDVDMAAESAEYARVQVMLQAATAMLAQANQVPQTVLQLLK
jgi:flagellin